MKKTLGLSKKEWLIVAHYPMLAAILVLYYSYVHTPSIDSGIAFMFVELSALLLVGDQIIHKFIIGVD